MQLATTKVILSGHNIIEIIYHHKVKSNKLTTQNSLILALIKTKFGYFVHFYIIIIQNIINDIIAK